MSGSVEGGIEDGRIDARVATHARAPGTLRVDEPAPGEAHGGGLFGVLQQAKRCVGKRFGVARLEEQAGLAVADELAVAADV